MYPSANLPSFLKLSFERQLENCFCDYIIYQTLVTNQVQRVVENKDRHPSGQRSWEWLLLDLCSQISAMHQFPSGRIFLQKAQHIIRDSVAIADFH